MSPEAHAHSWHRSSGLKAGPTFSNELISREESAQPLRLSPSQKEFLRLLNANQLVELQSDAWPSETKRRECEYDSETHLQANREHFSLGKTTQGHKRAVRRLWKLARRIVQWGKE
jgi:hypothetical protein